MAATVAALAVALAAAGVVSDARILVAMFLFGVGAPYAAMVAFQHAPVDAATTAAAAVNTATSSPLGLVVALAMAAGVAVAVRRYLRPSNDAESRIDELSFTPAAHAAVVEEYRSLDCRGVSVNVPKPKAFMLNVVKRHSRISAIAYPALP